MMHFSSVSLFVGGLFPLLAQAKYGYQTINRIKTSQGGALVYGRMDPVITPGKDSGHVHMVTGGNGFSILMGNQDALNANCTNSQIKKDGSNYWVPSLYFHKDGKFTSVPMNYMNVYYKFETTTDEIVPWEPGFRMVSGDPFLRSPPAAGPDNVVNTGKGEIQPVQWTCPSQSGSPMRWPANSNGMDGVGIGQKMNPGDSQPPGAGVGFPNQNCDVLGSPLRADIHFPSCSNPKARLDDYQNNSAFPDSQEKCPPGWLHHPHMFYEVYWSTMDFAGQWETGQNSQPFVLANGDTTGYGLHADFINGWDKEALQQVIDHCDTGTGGMDGCPTGGGLQPQDIYTDEEQNTIAKECSVKPHNPEKVLGTLTQLPGCNPLTKAGPPASKNPSCPGGQASSNTIEQGGGVVEDDNISSKTPIEKPKKETKPADPSTRTDPSGWSFAGCFADSTSARVLSGATVNKLGSMTIKMCTDFCEEKGFAVAGLEWKSECYCGRDMPTRKSNQCNLKCAGNQSQTCGGGKALSVYKRGPTTTTNKVRRHAAAHMNKHRVHARSMGFE